MSPRIDSLIVVCCHAIWLGGPTAGNNESEWLIAPFQRGETSTFISHIEAGVAAFKQSPTTILVFSGGATKQALTMQSEGQSYLELAFARGLLGGSVLDETAEADPMRFRQRIFVDEDATDSFQNILFPLLRFSVWATGSSPSPIIAPETMKQQDPLHIFPDRLTIVSHSFKKSRFIELHLPALGLLPRSDDGLQVISRVRVEYIGVDPPMDEVTKVEIERGDHERGYGAWKVDNLGRGKLLSEKRKERGWTEEGRSRVLEMVNEANRLVVEKGLLRGGDQDYWRWRESLKRMV